MGRSYAPNPVFQFFGDDGKPLVFGFLCTYIAGTNTPVATYDSDGKPNEVRMRLNGRGETDTAIMLDADMAYKFVLLRPDGSEIWTRDNVTASGSSGMAGTDISAEHPITKKMVGSTSLIGFDSTDIDKAISDETEARKEADKSLSDDIGVISKSLLTETSERKAADEELARAIGGKQGTLKDGDNIHIDDALKVNVVNRRTLMTKSPLTAEKLDTALVIGIRDGAFATAEALEAETAARKTGDEQNRQRIDKVDADLNSEIQNRIEAVSKKQDKYYVFDSRTSTVEDVQAAITDGRTIVSASGSNFVTWQGFIHGSGAELARVERDGWMASWYYAAGKWENTSKQLASVPTAGRLVVELNKTATLSYYDWTFVFEVLSIQGGKVNVKNPNATSVDYFTESRTYGTNRREAGVDISEGYDIAYAGNGDFNSIPTRIVMDFFTGTEWLELRLMQYTSGSNLVIDYRIGGSNV